MACKGKTKSALESEDILLMILDVNREILDLHKAKQNMFMEIQQQLIELTESTQDIANRISYFER